MKESFKAALAWFYEFRGFIEDIDRLSDDLPGFGFVSARFRDMQQSKIITESLDDRLGEMDRFGIRTGFTYAQDRVSENIIVV
jgi:hypothetical protein